MTDPAITPNMRVADILARHPETVAVLNKFGIQCQDCHAARYETIAEGARLHAIDLRHLLTALNTAAGRPRRLPLSPDRLPVVN